MGTRFATRCHFQLVFGHFLLSLDQGSNRDIKGKDVEAPFADSKPDMDIMRKAHYNRGALQRPKKLVKQIAGMELAQSLSLCRCNG